MAVFTLARDEREYLPRWLAYYGAVADPGRLYVLDHGTTDGSTDGDGFHRVPVDFLTTENADWMLKTVGDFQRELFRSADVVVYAEADEFLIPDPDVHPGGLAAYVRRPDLPLAVTAVGFDVCWDAADPPLDPARGVLEQRPRWVRRPHWDKTLIARKPLTWAIGFHNLHGGNRPNRDPHLILAHCHYADRETAWNRLRRRTRTAAPDPGPWSGQNKFADRGAFDAHFHERTSATEPVPARFHSLA